MKKFIILLLLVCLAVLGLQRMAINASSTEAKADEITIVVKIDESESPADKQARIEEAVMLAQYDSMTDEMRMNAVVLGE